VYGWLWRRLPMRTPWKLLVVLLVVLVVAVVLWYLVFPVVDTRLPFNDVDVQ